MEVTFYEDPACSWCWAFQPVATTFAFEFRDLLSPRHVMGGLRDRPTTDVDFTIHQWRKAEAVSGMPFECGIWKEHVLATTYLACRAVKAAALLDETTGLRLLRRLQEAFYVERSPIDNLDVILELAREICINTELLAEGIASGRAESLFARDRVEAAQYGFGFPTIILRNSLQEAPVILQGAVPYSDLISAMTSLDFPVRHRRRFQDCPQDWTRLFKVHRRLTLAEIHLATGMDRTKIVRRLDEQGLRQVGPFFQPADCAGKEAQVQHEHAAHHRRAAARADQGRAARSHPAPAAAPAPPPKAAGQALAPGSTPPPAPHSCPGPSCAPPARAPTCQSATDGDPPRSSRSPSATPAARPPE